MEKTPKKEDSLGSEAIAGMNIEKIEETIEEVKEEMIKLVRDLVDSRKLREDAELKENREEVEKLTRILVEIYLLLGDKKRDLESLEKDLEIAKNERRSILDDKGTVH